MFLLNYVNGSLLLNKMRFATLNQNPSLNLFLTEELLIHFVNNDIAIQVSI